MWMAKNFSLSIGWNYFATSHRKGLVDGIGGNVKRFAEKIVRQRNFVSNAQEFHDAILGLQNMKTFCVLKKNIKGVSNTRMMRSNGFDFKIFNTSNDAPHQNHTITDQEEGGLDDADDIDFQSSIQICTSIRNGTFILVVYKYRKGKKENFIPKKLVAIVQNIDVIDVAPRCVPI